MKKTAALTAVLLLVSTAAAQDWLTGSVDDALAKAKARNKLLLLDFFKESG